MMNKKSMLALAVALLAALAAGCQCSGLTASPSPAPTAAATARPTAAPSAPLSPGLPGSPGPSGSPDAGAVIPDFAEGKEVEADTVPEIVEAIRARFENGEINTIKHATQDGRQVYAVEIRTGATAETVYVLPDGTLLEGAATPGGADETDG